MKTFHYIALWIHLIRYVVTIYLLSKDIIKIVTFFMVFTDVKEYLKNCNYPNI